MPPKAKKEKKGKKDKNKDPNAEKEKLNQVERTFYEITIEDLNKKILNLHTLLQSLDGSNTVITDKLHELQYGRKDTASQLERTVVHCNETITRLENEIYMLNVQRKRESQMTGAKMFDLERKYKAMHDQLTGEVRMLMGKLNSIDEFLMHRDGLLARFEDQEKDLAERQVTHAEDLLTMQQKAVLEKDELKKEVELHLLQVSEDFTRGSELRNAGYMRRLIRENVALQKEIDIIESTQNKLLQHFDTQQERFREMSQQCQLLEHINDKLIDNSFNKLQIIEGLTDNFERLKLKYAKAYKYRRAYEKLILNENCAYYQYRINARRMAKLKKRVAILKQESHNLRALHQVFENEVNKLHCIILQIKSAVQSTIRTRQTASRLKLDEEYFRRQKLKRRNLLRDLLAIINANVGKMMSTPSIQTVSRTDSYIYQPDKKNLMQAQRESFFEVFKRPVAEEPLSQMWHIDMDKDSWEWVESRPTSENPIIDVEWGTPLYVSSSHSEEIIEAEEEPLEEGEGSSSTDGVEGAQKTEAGQPSNAVERKSRLDAVRSTTDGPAPKSSTMKIAQSPFGEEEIEEEDEVGEEDEEYNINLFY